MDIQLEIIRIKWTNKNEDLYQKVQILIIIRNKECLWTKDNSYNHNSFNQKLKDNIYKLNIKKLNPTETRALINLIKFKEIRLLKTLLRIISKLIHIIDKVMNRFKALN